jgi:peptidoglycan/LPS O-acetylase OafA/YrhL
MEYVRSPFYWFYSPMLAFLAGGFIGVDVFFVISGFLITRILFAELQRTGRIEYLSFLSRRVKRLFPAFLLVAIATLALSFLFPLPFGEQQGVAKSVIFSTLYVSNFYFAAGADSYFGGGAELIPFLHTWSLSVEEQFYFIWPWLLWLGYLKLKENRQLSAIIVATVLCFVGAILFVHQWPDQAYYLLPARAWELAVGACLAVSQVHLGERWRTPLGFWAIALIIIAATHISPEEAHPNFSMLVPVLATALLIWVCRSGPSKLQWVLEWQPIRQIGLASYAIYLWHWPLLSIYRITQDHFAAFWHEVAIGILSLVLGWLTYRLMERPIRSKNYSRRQIYQWFAAASMLLCGISVGHALYANYVDRFQSRFQTVEQALANIPSRACLDKPCPVSGSEVLLWGDSHAWMVTDFVEQAASRQNMKLSKFTRRECPPSTGYLTKLESQDRYESCVQSNDLARAHIVEQRENGLQTVILSARWTLWDQAPPFFFLERGAWERVPREEHLDRQEKFRRSTTEVVAWLRSMDLNVVILGPVPEFPFQARDCLQRFESCEWSSKAIQEQRQNTVDFLRNTAHQHGALFYDPFSRFCNDVFCTIGSENEVWYMDDDHLTRAGVNHGFSGLVFPFAKPDASLPRN